VLIYLFYLFLSWFHNTTPEELHEEEGVDKEVTQEITEPARVSTPEQPEKNSEGTPQE